MAEQNPGGGNPPGGNPGGGNPPGGNPGENNPGGGNPGGGDDVTTFAVTVLCPICSRSCHTMTDMFEHGHSENLIKPYLRSEEIRALKRAGR